MHYNNVKALIPKGWVGYKFQDIYIKNCHAFMNLIYWRSQSLLSENTFPSIVLSLYHRIVTTCIPFKSEGWDMVEGLFLLTILTMHIISSHSRWNVNLTVAFNSRCWVFIFVVIKDYIRKIPRGFQLYT